MRGCGTSMYAALALGFIILTNFASFGYGIKGLKSLRKDRGELSIVRGYQKHAAQRGDFGTIEDAECRIPVYTEDFVTNPGRFWLLFDNEDITGSRHYITNSRYSITVFAMFNSGPSKMYMRVKRLMKEIQLRPLGVDLSEIEYIKDSNRNIVGFFGYPHQENTRVRVSLAHQEEINRYNARPAFVFETGTSGAPALGTIRVHGSGMKYLQLKVNDKPLKISCLSDTPIVDTSGHIPDALVKLIDTEKTKLVYRRRISKEEPDNEQDEGPYQAMAVRGQSYQILVFRGVPQINRGSPVQQAITAESNPHQ